MKLQPITYWAPEGLGADNEPGYVAPVQIWGRWVEESTTVQDSTGETRTFKTHVIVDREVEEGGYLAHGLHLDELTPFTVDGAQEIQGFTSTPDLRYMEQIKRAYL